MKEYVTGAWAGLSERGRAVVLVAVVVAVGGLLAYAMFQGLDLGWIPGLLTGG